MTPIGRRTCRGFTLLEMLVVMVILGFLTSLALPAMQRWHDATQLRSRTAVVVDALRIAALKAAASRQTLVMDERSFKATADAEPVDDAASAAARSRTAPPASAAVNSHVVVEMPRGWTAKRVVEARFLANGLCKPGMVMLTTERGEQVVVKVSGPLCAVEQLRGADAEAATS
jgi:prepilin-type N-terminal cleavage/methylation domain-containing protein